MNVLLEFLCTVVLKSIHNFSMIIIGYKYLQKVINFLKQSKYLKKRHHHKAYFQTFKYEYAYLQKKFGLIFDLFAVVRQKVPL